MDRFEAEAEAERLAPARGCLIGLALSVAFLAVVTVTALIVSRLL